MAWHFARGHRDIRVPDPVVATGTINKSNILWATDCRNECEILGEPRDIKVEDFRLEQLIAYVGWHVVDDVLNYRDASAEDSCLRRAQERASNSNHSRACHGGGAHRLPAKT